jgi:quinol monooxygenase YgiN
LSNPSIAGALYRSKPGMKDDLLNIINIHIPTLREENLNTSRESMLMESTDGTFIEIFEWRSDEAKKLAHHSPKVQHIWSRMEKTAEFIPFSSLAEASVPFANFQPLNIKK